MKSKLLLIGLMFALGSASGLAQFSLTAALTKIDDTPCIVLTASGPSDVDDVLGATFTIEIHRNIDYSSHLEEPLESTPFFYLEYFAGTPSPGIVGTPFAQSLSYVYTPDVYSGTIDTLPEISSGVAVNWKAAAGYGVDVKFAQSGPQRMLSAGINIPPDLDAGKWRLVLQSGAYNELVNGRIWFSNLQSDYILSYDGKGNLTLDVPEPSQFALVGGLALLGFAGWRRSRK